MRFNEAKRPGPEPTAEAKRRRLADSFVSLLMGKPEPPADAWAADDDEVNSGGLGVFRDGPASSGAEPLALVAKRQPGRLFEQGLQKIRERLTALQGGTVDSRPELRRVLSFYHQVIFRPLAQQRGRADRSARRQMQGARLQETLLNLSQRSEAAGR